MCTYTCEQLLSFRSTASPLPRYVRKRLFKYRLWYNHYSRSTQPLFTVLEPDQPPPYVNMNERMTDKHILLGHINAQSIHSKSAQLTNAIAENSIDILAITEMWHESSDDVTLKQVTPDGYICFDKARTRPISLSSTSSRGGARRVTGGGTALIFRNVFKSKQIEFQFNPKTFEYVAGVFILGTTCNIVVVIYRPGSQAVSSAFFDEFSNLLELLVTYNCGIIITGDLNIHLDVVDNTHTIRFNKVLEGFDLSQHITGPTHRAGHTLDVFITKTDQLVPIGTAVCPQVISDHSLIIATLPQSKPETVFFNATVRGWKRLDKKAFQRDLISSDLCTSCDEWMAMSLDDMVSIYQDTLTGLLDKHTPRRTMQKRYRPMTPWFNEACVKQKRKARCLERVYCRNKSDQNRAAWLAQLRSSQEFYRQTKDLYWQTTVAESSGNSSLMGKKKTSPIQEGLDAQGFLRSFKHKVENVHSSTTGLDPPYYLSFDGDRLFQFSTIDQDRLLDLLAKAPNKSCGLDPAPTWLIKEYAVERAPFLTVLFNRSIASGIVPQTFKVAEITPILKKASLDATVVLNYCPISNLPFLLKLLERIIKDQLETHLDAANLLPECQSAYRKSHSTETALLKVTSDTIMAANAGMVTILGFLDLSAAFDCVDHPILFQRLTVSFGIDLIALAWIASYFANRKCRVRYNGVLSQLSEVDCGVPQGSVFGPVFFTLYSSGVFSLVDHHGFIIHGYADDLQIYQHCLPQGMNTLGLRLTKCNKEIEVWMSSNRLHLNVSKTEFQRLLQSDERKKFCEDLEREDEKGNVFRVAKQMVRRKQRRCRSKLCERQ